MLDPTRVTDGIEISDDPILQAPRHLRDVGRPPHRRLEGT